VWFHPLHTQVDEVVMDLIGYVFHTVTFIALVLVIWIALGVRHLMNIAFTTRRPNRFLTLPITWILDRVGRRRD
jgi:hypothetical protein